MNEPRYLLDASTLVALLWQNHVHHDQATAWSAGKTLVLCPITELGFLRVSTSLAYNATMTQARDTLNDFLKRKSPEFIPADTRALDGEVAPSSAKTTDWYLANLALNHGMKWATLDERAEHPNAELVS
jgi:predicted nucleic acid-binding protein